MRVLMNITLIFFTLLFTFSCGRQIDCPGFDDKVLDWLPYQTNDIITLTNMENDSVLSLIVNDIVVKHTTHYMTNLDCGTCNDYIEINEFEDRESNLYIEIQLNENQINSEHYSVKGSDFDDYHSNYSEIKDYDFEGVIYDNIKIFENVGSEDYFVKLFLAKGFGVIGLIDKSGNVWILESSFLKKNNIQSIKIQNISCG